MKSRKLFAILTLVAFMMTLLPVAAFAADRHASILKVDTTSVEADGEKDAEFTVYVRNSDNSADGGAVVYVASERNTTDTIAAKSGYTQVDGGNYQAITADANGKVEFTVTSKVAGEARIAVGLNDQVYAYLTDSDVTSSDAAIIGTKTITFEATDASNVTVASVSDRDGAVTVTTDDATEGDTEYTVDATVKANGVDYYEIKFAVTNGSGAPVEGEDIKVSANKNGITFNKTELETDEVGEAKVKVYATEPDTYEIEARVGSDKATVNVEFLAGDVNGIELDSNVDPLIATDVNTPDDFKIKLTDVNGNKVKAETVDLDEILDFEWITEPSDSDLDDNWAMSGYTNAGDTTDFVSYDSGLLKVKLPKLEEEGKYVLRVNIDNGKYVDVEFEAKEQGDIVKLTLEYDQASLPLGAVSSHPSVKRIDAAGVSVSVDYNDTDLEYAISDYRILADGHKDIDAENGVLYVTDNDDYIGTAVVTVVDKQEDLSATTSVTIGKEAIAFDLEAPADVVEVGEEGQVALKLKDADGNVVALGDGVNTVTFDYYVTAKPEGALVSADEESKFKTHLIEDGVAYFDVVSNKAGKATFTVVVKVDYTDADRADLTLTKNVTVEFGEKAPEVEIGAKNVTMFINSTGYVVDGTAKTTDVAPFIQDSRTFVPVRMISEALGADVEWDPATQTVTIERADKTISLTIGSNVLTVSDGSTIVSDVAPFIKDSRTVLPFRAIGEAFGAQVEAVFAADGTVTAVTFAQ